MDLQLLKARQEKEALLAEIAERDCIIKSQDEEIVKLKEKLQGVKSQLSVDMSPAQIDCIFSKKAAHCWLGEDISHALSLNLSTKAYKYVRNEWKIPLPSISVCNHRTAQVNVEPGILVSALSSLEK